MKRAICREKRKKWKREKNLVTYVHLVMPCTGRKLPSTPYICMIPTSEDTVLLVVEIDQTKIYDEIVKRLHEPGDVSTLGLNLSINNVSISAILINCAVHVNFHHVGNM